MLRGLTSGVMTLTGYACLQHATTAVLRLTCGRGGVRCSCRWRTTSHTRAPYGRRGWSDQRSCQQVGTSENHTFHRSPWRSWRTHVSDFVCVAVCAWLCVCGCVCVVPLGVSITRRVVAQPNTWSTTVSQDPWFATCQPRIPSCRTPSPQARRRNDSHLQITWTAAHDGDAIRAARF